MSNPLLDAIGSALSGAGYVLDTPGALLRGALSGRIGERASGRDMLESWGMLDPNQEGFDAGDVAGFGADLLFDPLNLVGAGLVKRGLGMADDVADASKAIGAVPTSAGTLLPETSQRLKDLATADIPTVGPGRNLMLREDPAFKEAYIRSQDWSTVNDKTGRRVKVPNALVVAKIEAETPGQGAYRALHDELAQYGRPIVVESVGNESFNQKLRHMGYQELDAGYDSGLGNSFVYPPMTPAQRTAPSINPLLAAIAGQNALQVGSGY